MRLEGGVKDMILAKGNWGQGVIYKEEAGSIGMETKTKVDRERGRVD